MTLEDGTRTVDPEKCVGCGTCVAACPWHMPCLLYTSAYAGGVELDCEFQDAVIVSFYQRGMSMGYSAYVLYEGCLLYTSNSFESA